MPASRSSARPSGCCPTPSSPVAPMFWAVSGLPSLMHSSSYWPRVDRVTISSAARRRRLYLRAGPRGSKQELHSAGQRERPEPLPAAGPGLAYAVRIQTALTLKHSGPAARAGIHDRVTLLTPAQIYRLEAHLILTCVGACTVRGLTQC